MQTCNIYKQPNPRWTNEIKFVPARRILAKRIQEYQQRLSEAKEAAPELDNIVRKITPPNSCSQKLLLFYERFPNFSVIKEYGYLRDAQRENDQNIQRNGNREIWTADE